jgi:hypothetical protein
VKRDLNFTDHDALVSLVDAASDLCDQVESAGHRWSKFYEVRALISGIRINVLNPNTTPTKDK